jgi:glycine/D-amino acid oxidase-like deaminating enzyme
MTTLADPQPAHARVTDGDLVIVGGGVMGLFTAYYASALGRRVSVLERGRVGDPATASYGRTRSYRNDYLDPAYVRLAREAIRLWDAFEAREEVRVLVRCGCLNIANSRVTPDLAATYARMSHRLLEDLGMPTEALGAEAIRSRFPGLDADVGQLDPGAGVVDLAAVRDTLARVLAERGVRIVEGAQPDAIARGADGFTISAGEHRLTARSLVITAGHGTNEVLARLPGCALRVPIEKDRPSDARYFDPPREDRPRFTAGAMPVVAYLDAGIYCHPIVPGVVDQVKVGYYNPPDVPRGTTSIDSIDAFVEQCFPGLRGMPSAKVEDVDQCDYDLVADDDFVLGPIPGAASAFVGVGWRGTGYKFAPWVGRVLAELAVQSGTVYDIARFAPARFQEGAATDAPVATDPATAAH